MHWYYWAAIGVGSVYLSAVVAIRWIDRNTGWEVDRILSSSGRKDFERNRGL